MPKLIARDGNELVVAGEEVSVGRGDGGDQSVDLDLGTLERGRTVSRRHARIYREQSAWHLRVEPSAMNETKVAGKPLKPGEEALLTDGDEILLGAVELTFRTDFDPEATMVRRAQAPAELRADGLVFPLAAPEGRRLWIGRPDRGAQPAADMIDLSNLAGSRSVSHRHAQVYKTAAGWTLHEGQTTNPTMVAGRELQPGEDVVLTDGVSIQLGRVLVTFHEVRPVRVVSSDILLLEAEESELTVDPGHQQFLNLRLVNATGRVEMVEVDIEGLPREWYQFAHDGITTPTWRVQLVPTGPDLINPLPNSYSSARVVIMAPRVPQSRAGIYPITIAATTQGEDRVRRVIAGTIHVLAFEGLELTLSPTEAKGASGKYTAEVVNSGNADANVGMVLEMDPGLIVKSEPDVLKMANGANQRAAIKARVRHHHIWGPRRTYGLHVSAVAGTQKLREGASLTCYPWVPEWLQGLLRQLYAFASPIAIPAVTLVLLLGLAYLFLRPPQIASFYANSPAVPAGGTDQLNWSGDRIVSVEIDPPVSPKPVAADGQVTVTPDKSQDYTLTAHNWIGLSSTAKVHIAVINIKKFAASTTNLQQEKQEVQLSWDTDAESVSIDPPDEIKDPKTTGDAKVHPPGNTTYTLTAHGPGGVDVKQSIDVNIGPPTLDGFAISDPPSGTRIFPGSPVKLTWKATGVTKAVLTSDKGDVRPGQKELDVSGSGSPPATVQPNSVGDTTYTLTVSNAAGEKKDTVKVSVSPLAIQFDADPTTVTAGAPVKLRWKVDGASDNTQISIDNDIGKVAPTGDKTVNPTDNTDYTLTVVAPDGTKQEQKVTVSVKAPPPKINTFTAPTPEVKLGDQVRMTWIVDNADSIEIRTDQGDLIVQTKQLSGSVIDIPPASTTYILTAIGPSGQSKATFSVVVGTSTPTPAPSQQPAVTSPSPAPAAP